VGVWTYLQDAIIVYTYTTALPLIEGNTYKFKVEARNAVGYSDLSDEIAILAGEIPGTTAAPTTTSIGANILIAWSAPDDGGTSITAYVVSI
jgi:hypothetical protein